MAPIRIAAAVTLVALLSFGAKAAESEAIAAKGETVVLQVHAAGAQIYECKADASGRAAWQFREPIASLFRDGKTVGRHYAGPTWEIDLGPIVGKGVGRAPGATTKDIPWKLDVSDRHGDGPLKDVIRDPPIRVCDA
jgi:hypothetical protein